MRAVTILDYVASLSRSLANPSDFLFRSSAHKVYDTQLPSSSPDFQYHIFRFRQSLRCVFGCRNPPRNARRQSRSLVLSTSSSLIIRFNTSPRAHAKVRPAARALHLFCSIDYTRDTIRLISRALGGPTLGATTSRVVGRQIFAFLSSSQEAHASICALAATYRKKQYATTNKAPRRDEYTMR